ncbi:ABC transporter permease [Miniphocaeibacter halophilus]|uniref:ABC transporter permease n=1 Tax=Miniphocaeibacter halophilus TaxID=2931922 RepID=A0AC61MVC4_9FIRM|nr:FtsX-like permease family protein [Miniphocaeibacter halophilus]QQK08579.1 ABC transporter permease [Miniphocaeibacter halophilus]
MFSHLIKGNSKRLRRENRIYFSTLIIAIIAFYIILSLGEQNVVKFLRTMETDAIERFLAIISALYLVSLVIMFFLTYFANKHQLDNRKKEFGIYLMMGMKRRRLFSMILLENLRNGLIALIIGIPISILITEMISLASSKLVGMGIVGYSFSISLSGLMFTIIGFIIIQLLALIILSFKIIEMEPYVLINGKKEENQKISSRKSRGLNFIIGIIFLGIAYILGMNFYNPESGSLGGVIISYISILGVFFFGILGVFLFFKGFGGFMGNYIRRKSMNSSGLYIFTGRQLQENVLKEYVSMAISSLLVLISILCFIYGISVISGRETEPKRVVDFTFEVLEEESKSKQEELENIMNAKGIKPYIKDYYPMKISNISFSLLVDGAEQEDFIGEYEHSIDWSNPLELLKKEEDSVAKENLLESLKNNYVDHGISLESYNGLLKSIGQDEILLKEDEIAIFVGPVGINSKEIWENILKDSPTIKIDNREYRLKPKLFTDNVVADRKINLITALILPDKLYNELVHNPDHVPYWNMNIRDEIIEEKGLMQAVMEVDNILKDHNLEYESFLSSIGRSLFFTVAGSYTSLYLGILFLIVANTVLAIKFLMQQENTINRYKIVSYLGASRDILKKSARKQIWVYFLMVIGLAIVNSVFGTITLFGDFFMDSKEMNMDKVIIMAIVTGILFIILEFCYIVIIQRKSDKEVEKAVDNFGRQA